MMKPAQKPGLNRVIGTMFFLALLSNAPLAWAQTEERKTAEAPAVEKATPARARTAEGAEQPRERSTRGEGHYPMSRERWGESRMWPAPPPMTEEQIKEALELLREYRPEMAKRFEELREKSPERAQELMRPMLGRLMELSYLKRTDPEAFELRKQDYRLWRSIFELSGKVREARAAKDAAKVEELTAELRKQLAEQFDVRQKLRERELVRMESKLEEMRKQVEERKTSRDKLIQSRFEELSTTSAKPEW